MEVGRWKMMKNPKLLNIVWMFVGILLVGGVYCLSYFDIDQTMVSESKNFFDFVRAALQ
jgi:hypothetical protein